MKTQHYHYIVLSFIVSITAMMMSERAATAVPKAWVEMSSGTTESLNGIWGTSATDIFVVGSGETILRYDGNSWFPMTSGGNTWLSGVWGSTSNDVFAVGSSGTILHYDGGSSWTTMSPNPNADLSSVWGLSANDVFVVGDNGTILYYDGDTWSTMSSNTSENLRGIWGSSSTDIFAVGLNGTILHYDGSDWTTMTSNSSQILYSVWGSANNDVFTVGTSGTILHYDGSNWITMTSNTSNNLNSIWGSANNNVFAIGTDTSLHYDGTDWIPLDTATSGISLEGVWGADENQVFIVGEQGKILQLAPSLIINTTGSGTGTVTATTGLNSGIDCGTTCQEYYSFGSSVNIAAIAGASSNFTGWGGDCSGTTNSLTVTMDTSLNCTAHFEAYTLSINKTGNGTGTVTGSNGINCGSVCSKDYPQETTVTLTATPQSGSTFGGWSGACSGASDTVTVTVNGSLSCTATFSSSSPTLDASPSSPRKHPLTVIVAGRGKVTSKTHKFINCKDRCEYNFNFRTKVQLTTTPDQDWEFDHWEGDCNEEGLVIMMRPRQCKAVFMLKISEELQDLIEKFGHVRTIYRYSSDNPRRSIRAVFNKPIIRFNTIPHWVQTVDEEELSRLRQNLNIVSIEIDRPLFPSSPIDSAALNSMGVSSINNLGYSGAGQTVAVLDTGVDSNSIPVAEQACFSTIDGNSGIDSTSICSSPNSGEECTGTGCDHGTQVAERILAVAPEAQIISIQIFSQSTNQAFCNEWSGINQAPCIFAFTSDLIRGIEQVLTFKNSNNINITAANLSLAHVIENQDRITPEREPKFYSTDCQGAERDLVVAGNTSIGEALGNLYTASVAPIMAAGNNSKSNEILWPSCLRKVISVGATTVTGTTERVANYSNNAIALDLLAPELIVPTNPHPSVNGTSMAAAYVSGAWAVLKQAVPSETIANIKSTLNDTGQPISDSRIGSPSGKKRIQVDEALAKLLCTNPNDTICVIGNGIVKSVGYGGINCRSSGGASCSPSSIPSRNITLVAIPDLGHTLVGWGGANCSGKSNITELTKDPSNSTTPKCIARFKKVPTTLFSNWQDYPCFNKPTIQTKGDGDWTSTSIWDRIDSSNTTSPTPINDDVVLVRTNHKITVDPTLVRIKTLCNYGTLESRNVSDLVIEARGGIKNVGTIEGQDGVIGRNVTLITAKVAGYNKDGATWWHTSDMSAIPGPIDNEGMIQGGKGNLSFPGGNVIVLGRNVTNLSDGVKSVYIKGGKGVTQGGLVQVFGRFGGSKWGTAGNLISTGSIVAGDGTGALFPWSRRGNGGNLWLIGWPNVYLGPGQSRMNACARCTSISVPNHSGGKGHFGGTNGWVKIEPGFIEIAAGTEVKGGDITIFGGDDWTLKLSEEADIESYGDITLAVGKNSVVDLTGNTKRVLKAANQVTIFADDVRTDSEVTLANLIESGNEIVSAPSKILYAATLTGPTQINGQPDEEVSIRFTLLNSGPTQDTYTLNVSDLSGWTFSPVTASVEVPELDSVDMGVTVTLPSTLGAENIITVVATSQADPSVKAMAQTYVLVATEEMLKNFTVSEDSLLMRLNQELPADTETVTPVIDDNTVEDEVEDEPVVSSPPDETRSDQAQESDIFTSIEATLEWLEANNLSPEDLTEEQLDALPITWDEPIPVEPPMPPEPELTTANELDEMEQLLVSINRKDVLEQAEVDRLNELSEILLVIAETIAQNYQDATQAALDQERIEPLTQFESQIKPLQNKLTAIAMLGQNAMERLQVGEMLLSQDLVNSITDEELAIILSKQGLKAHSEAGIISATRSQAISELEIPALELDILDVLDSGGDSCSVNSTAVPISYLDSALDLLFPKAQAAAVLSCVAICASQGFGPRCVSCIVRKGVDVTRTLIKLVKRWKRCRGWRKWWCRTKIIVKIIYYVG